MTPALCSICDNPYKNKHTLKTHQTDCHDGEANRSHKLQCTMPGCSNSFQSRQKFELHIAKHVKGPLNVQRRCPQCDQEFARIEDLDKHLDEHENDGYAEEVQQSKDVREQIQQMRDIFTSAVGNRRTTLDIIGHIESIVVTLESGKEVHVLALPGSTERILSSQIVSVNRLRQQPGSLIFGDEQ